MSLQVPGTGICYWYRYWYISTGTWYRYLVLVQVQYWYQLPNDPFMFGNDIPIKQYCSRCTGTVRYNTVPYGMVLCTGYTDRVSGNTRS